MGREKELISHGATILDIGAESTSPLAEPITQKIEWARLADGLKAILEIKKTSLIMPKISVDTRHSKTAEKALLLGVDIINDVSGLDDPAMQKIVASAKSECIIMHHLQIPERRTHYLPRDEEPCLPVYFWGEQRIHELEKMGIARDKIIFDPGIGFGKMAEQSFSILQSIDIFKKLGVRLLVGHSRKSYLSLLTEKPPEERDIETSVISLYLANKKVDYLRVHNVEIASRVFKVAGALGAFI